MIHRNLTFASGHLVGRSGGVALVNGFSWGMYLVTATYATFLVAVLLGTWAIMLGIGEAEKQRD